MIWWAVGGAVFAVGLAASWRLGRRSAQALVVAEQDRHPGPSADERLVAAMRFVPIGVVVADGDGDVIYRNDYADRFTSGRHTDTLVDAAIVDVITLSLGGSPAERELDLYGPPRQFLQIRAAPFLGDDEQWVIVFIEDVSERQRVEAVRRDFVANVSHELKTPVGALGVLAETLSERTDDPAVVERLSSRLTTEAHRLGNTIDDLLELSWLEAGDTFDPEPVDASAVVATALERCGALAEARRVRIQVEEEPGCVVAGERRQLSAAVSNLVENAVKYSDEAGVVTIEIECRDDVVAFVVTDTGVGIPPADLERIFERFYRVDPARSRSTGGTGLGLSIVRHVVVNHGGDIRVSSVEGEGSRFEMIVPAVVPAPGRSTLSRATIGAPHDGSR